jgi:hypothetical protein
MTWDQTRASAVRNRRLNAGAIAYIVFISGDTHKVRPSAHFFDEPSFPKDPQKKEEDDDYTHTPSEITTVDQESEEASAVINFFYFLLGLCALCLVGRKQTGLTTSPATA